MSTTTIRGDIEISQIVTYRNYDKITNLYQKNAIWEIQQIEFIIEVLKILVVDSKNISKIDAIYDEQVDPDFLSEMMDIITQIMEKLIGDKKKVKK